MKKITTLIICLFTLISIGKAQYVNLPDTNFRNFLMNKYPTCFNASKQMDTTCSAIVNEDTLSINGSWIIRNIFGVQYFKNLQLFSCDGPDLSSNALPQLPSTLLALTFYYCKIQNISSLPANLKTLYLPGNLLTSLPKLPNNLQQLYCSYNSLTALPSLPATLINLTCSNNSLTTLPSLPNSINYLDCSSNLLTTLPSLSNSLKQLNCTDNKITAIPALPNTLISLDCANNQLTTLPSLPNSLNYRLDCNNNQLVSLPTLPNNLPFLYCSGNKLTSLPNLPTSLNILTCNRNLLSSLPAIPSGISYLECSNNKLTSFPAINSMALTNLFCGKNLLTVLPDLSNCVALENFFCDSNSISNLPNLPSSIRYLKVSHNKITTLNSWPSSLRILECDNNQISEFKSLPYNLLNLNCDNNPIACLPKLPPNLNYISTQATNITCLPHYINSTCVLVPQLNVCNSTNNINQCHYYPTVFGKVFYDNNKNLNQDTDEPNSANNKVTLDNNRTSFSNDSGVFYFIVDTIGSHTFKVIPPAFFGANPITTNVVLNKYDTAIRLAPTALQATTTKDSLYVVTTTYQPRVRRNGVCNYLVSCRNLGTTTLSPTVSLIYDTANLIYVGSTIPSATITGNTISAAISNFVPGKIANFDFDFRVKITAPLGTKLPAYTNLNNGSIDAYDTSSSLIVGSFDPNDKEATPELSTQQVADGKRINYTIRFENTGNDTAIHIVIADTLSNKLQANSLQMISTSHNCKTIIKDGMVYFEMRDIMLPDSNTNKQKCSGFVRFSVLPKTNLVVGDVIPNTASIYFDYNKPVVTNTAKTVIKNIILPLQMLDFTATLKDKNVALLNWQTANEVNTQSFIIQQSLDGRIFKSVNEVVATNAHHYTTTTKLDDNLNYVYFRLIIKDKDGSYAYSKIVKLTINNEQGLTILTNPAKATLQFTVSNNLLNTTANIINANGVVVKQFVVTNTSQKVLIANLPKGLYYLQVKDCSKKFIVE